MKISFIIPLYNCENYIGRCLNSIIKIKYNNYEVVVVNDGSTDESEKIVERYCERYQNIRLYTKQNEGLSVTRNFGVNKAEGDYLFFIDADDMILEKEVDKIIELCKENKYDVIAGTYLFLYENNNQKGAPFIMKKNHSCSDLKYLLTLSQYTAEAVKYIVKKDFFVNNNLFFKEHIFHEDELYMPKLLTTVNENKLCIFYEPFYLYRKHENTITTSINIKKQFDMIYISKEIYKMIDKVNDQIKKNFLKSRANLIFISCCSGLYLFKTRDKQSLIQELKYLLGLFKNNKTTRKEKIAYCLIKIIGFNGFSYLQKIRKK